MSSIETITHPSPWKARQKAALRLFFLYFFLQAVPLDWKFYRKVFSIAWAQLHYGAIFDLAHYSPALFSATQGYADWLLLFILAAAGAVVWSIADRRRARTDAYYDNLYYWIRVIVRYRLAVGMIAYGFIKLYPLQAPFPSLSNLNTNYGDFTRWKLFSMSLGIVPTYESFLGLVEFIGGLLLLYRKSASIGALIILIFLGNVYMSNIAYGGGDAVYSLYLISFALFILSYDLQRLSDLLIFQRPAAPNRFSPVLSGTWRRAGRVGLKAAFVLFFVVLYGFKTRNGYRHEPYQFPDTKGLEGAAGIYNVEEFRINKDSLGYSKVDPIRWQDVVFEKWATLSVRSNRPVVLDPNNVERPEAGGRERTYELEGSAARHYYSYEADTAGKVITLQNKNPYYAGEKWVLHYSRPDSTRIVLWGIGPGKDSVYVVLNRIHKKYLLEEAAHKGRDGGLKL